MIFFCVMSIVISLVLRKHKDTHKIFVAFFTLCKIFSETSLSLFPSFMVLFFYVPKPPLILSSSHEFHRLPRPYCVPLFHVSNDPKWANEWLNVRRSIIFGGKKIRCQKMRNIFSCVNLNKQCYETPKSNNLEETKKKNWT